MIRIVHIEALVVAGDHVGAQAALDAGLARLAERAAHIVDPARRARFLHDIPENGRLLELGEQARAAR